MSSKKPPVLSEALPIEPIKQHLIAYTDGGARPNPGAAGWGLHGYLYHLAVPTKGSGNPSHILTALGYIAKEDIDPNKKHHQPVTPISYIDGFGSFDYSTTNNVGELSGALNALQFAVEHDLVEVKIVSDSEYLKKGMEGWTKGWAKNGWKRSDGTEITNVGVWRKLYELNQQLINRGVKVDFTWVRGHGDDFGNELSDKWATLGVFHSKHQKVINSIDQKAPEGYWRYDADSHPFVSLPAIYYNTLRNANKPGEYYLGNQYKEIELLGKRISDGAFAVVRLAKPEAVIQTIQDYQVELARGTDHLMFMRLDQLYRADTHKEVSTYGYLATDQPNPHRYDLDCLDGEPLARELSKPKLGFRAIENISALSEKLDEFLATDPNIHVTDLTPILYETIVKTDKKGGVTSRMEMKPNFKVGFAALEVDATYGVDAATGELYSAPVILTLGIDLLDRNRLKRLESRNPKVSLITWMDSDVAFRHATVIQTDEDAGIWAGMYSNIRLLPAQLAKTDAVTS